MAGERRDGIYIDAHRYVSFEEVARALSLMTAQERAFVMMRKRDYQDSDKAVTER